MDIYDSKKGRVVKVEYVVGYQFDYGPSSSTALVKEHVLNSSSD